MVYIYVYIYTVIIIYIYNNIQSEVPVYEIAKLVLSELQELWFMNVYHTCNYIHGNLKIIFYLGWAYSADFGDALGIVKGVQP